MQRTPFLLAAVGAVALGGLIGLAEPIAHATSCGCAGEVLWLSPTNVPGEVCAQGAACPEGFSPEANIQIFNTDTWFEINDAFGIYLLPPMEAP